METSVFFFCLNVVYLITLKTTTTTCYTTEEILLEKAPQDW